MSPYLQDDARPPSSKFLKLATTLSKTQHENRFADQFYKFGLSANFPVSYVEVGLKNEHPVHRVKDVIHTLAANDKLDKMFWVGNSPAVYEAFWYTWKQVEPKHPIFSKHASCLGQCVPICIHCDEGTTLKKKGIMIIQVQPLIGKGTRKRKASSDVPGCNILGHSLISRYLWSVMLTRFYSSKKLKNKPLLRLVEHLATELSDVFYNGIQFTDQGVSQTCFLVPVALKGDWPALTKIAQLLRHFGRSAAGSEDKGFGICHFCRADQPGYKNWHDLSFDNMLGMRSPEPELPWHVHPSICSAIPLPDSYKPSFFRIDIFHTLHKGVLADVAANTIVLLT